jgi:HAD superfamily hydrolase (TIGR01509 family)
VTKAIIFDCFGVLVTEAWEPFCDQNFGDNPELTSKAHNLAHQLNTGQITYNQFIDGAADLAGINSAQAREFIDNNQANTPLFSYIKDRLKPKYKIGMLSNAGDNWLAKMFTPDQLKLFDDVVLSYMVQFIKPQQEIYQLSAHQLGVLPEECIFVDDLQKHVDGALRAGMKVVLYQDFEQTKQDLEKVLAKG